MIFLHFDNNIKRDIFLHFVEPLAQVVEQLPFKQWVAGSSPARLIYQPQGPRRLAWPRTPAFHAGNRGSNPLGDAKINYSPIIFISALFFLLPSNSP